MSTRRSRVVDLDLDVVVDQRRDVDLGEAGVAARRGVEGRDPDQPVDAALGGEQPVGVLAAGDEGRRLQPGLLPRRGLLHLDLEAAPLGPAQVHAQQHLGPVLGVGAARAGVDRDDGVAGVVLAAEEPRLLELGQAPLDRGELRRQLGGHLLVLGRQLRQLAEVVDVGLERPEGLQPALRAGVLRGDRAPPSPGRPRSPGRCISASSRSTSRLERGRVKGSPRAASAARGSRRGARRFPPSERFRPCHERSRDSARGGCRRLLGDGRADDPGRGGGEAPSRRGLYDTRRATSRRSRSIFGRIRSTVFGRQIRSSSAAGPSAMLKATAWSRSLPILIGRSQRVKVDLLEAGDLQLLADRVGVRHRERARAAGRRRRSPRAPRGTARRPARPGAPTRCRACAARRPRPAGRPGRSAPRMLRSACTGLAKNISPIRENA